MQERTQLLLNASIESGMPGYPHAQYRFSVDGTNSLPEPIASGLDATVQAHNPTVVNTAFPYVQVRCLNAQGSGTPVVVWMVK